MWRFGGNRASNSCLQIQINLKGADWSRNLSPRSGTSMALDTNPAMSRSSAVRGQCDIIYATIGQVLRKALADGAILGDECE